jgi:hypothetical protein
MKLLRGGIELNDMKIEGQEGKTSKIRDKIRKMAKVNFNHEYILYTITFLLLLPIIFLPFFIEGKSFVWYVDGICQHYPILEYYGNFIRGILTGKGLPMVDYKLGFGFDTITTLHYYAIGDPISLLTVFFTKNNMVFGYSILVFICRELVLLH